MLETPEEADEAAQADREFSGFGNAVEATFLWPPFVAVTTILGVLAGFVGAAFEHKISESTSFAFQSLADLARGAHLEPVGDFFQMLGALFEPGSAFEVQAVVFLVVAGLFGIFFGATLWAQSRSAERATAGLRRATSDVARKTSGIADQTRALSQTSEQVEKLVLRLQTLPPEGFLPKFKDAVPVMLSPWVRHAGQIQLDDRSFESLVRSQLRSVLTIASAFEADADQVRYGCNIMLFRKSEHLPEAERTRLQGLLRFAEPDVDVKNLFGTLELIPVLSAAAKKTDFECPDSTIQGFVLPVPRPKPGPAGHSQQPEPPSNTLPGAPYALLKRSPGFLRGGEDLQIFSKNEHFSVELRKAWIDSFRNHGGAIVSFMSFPIFDPTEEKPEWPIAILNVHRDKDDREVGDKVGLLWPLMPTVLISLGVLIRVYIKRANAIL